MEKSITCTTRGLEFSQSFLENVLNSDKPEENILLISGLPRTAREEDIKNFIEDYTEELTFPLGKIYYILMDPDIADGVILNSRAIVVLDKWYDFSINLKSYFQKGEHLYTEFHLGDEEFHLGDEKKLVKIESLWLSNSNSFGFRI